MTVDSLKVPHDGELSNSIFRTNNINRPFTVEGEVYIYRCYFTARYAPFPFS